MYGTPNRGLSRKPSLGRFSLLNTGKYDVGRLARLGTDMGPNRWPESSVAVMVRHQGEVKHGLGERYPADMYSNLLVGLGVRGHPIRRWELWLRACGC
jgi:hypothetical protein